jgi:hypothetical protein
MTKIDFLNKLEEVWGKLYLFHPYSDKISGDVWLESLASGVELLDNDPNEATLVTVIQQLCALLDDPLTTICPKDIQKAKDVSADLKITFEDIEHYERYESLIQRLKSSNFQ